MDDPLWKEYVEKAEEFDKRMIDDWNKIVDVILVYVGIISSLNGVYHLMERRLV